MKNAFRSAKKINSSESSFSGFSCKDILSPMLMSRIRGGDGGSGGIDIPPLPPKT